MPAPTALRDDICRMFHRSWLCFIPRMKHSPIYDAWSVLVSTSHYLPPVLSTWPADWQVDRSRWIDQMICEALLVSPPVASLPLGTTDVPEMLELTAATEPGPFLPQTIRMGSYLGIRASDGRLVARAGERLQSTAFAEISAVCTHPEFRGRGYARALVTFLAAQILAAGKTPFLHVKSENGAKVAYQKIGFRLRAAISLTVISFR